MDRSRWQGFRIDRPGSATTSYVAMNAMYQHVEIDALDVRTSRSIKILVKNRNRTVHLEISIQRSNLILWSYPFILQFFILLEYPSWNSHQSPCNNPSYCPPHSYWSQWWSYSWIRNGWLRENLVGRHSAVIHREKRMTWSHLCGCQPSSATPRRCFESNGKVRCEALV